MTESPQSGTERDPERSPTTRSSTGLDQNIASLLCYLGGFITGVVFLVLEKENREVRFHAYQSLATFGGLFVLNLVVSAIPLLGGLATLLLSLVSLILWVLLMVKAFQGERLTLPVIGDWAEEQAKR